jgi:pre-mRNA-splicing factor ATP-dependent RNA helicase DHX15/PRP43
MDRKIGVLDPDGIKINPLTQKEYSQNYKDLAKVWSKFPAYSKKEEILYSIDKYQLIFIIAGTGSGKTALIPKFALHYTNYHGKVVVTLPKRIVTLSAAMFAARTLDVQLGTSVGYAYKGSDKKMLNQNNKLIYMTDGYFVMEFVRDPLLTDYHFVIIDEAHERRVQIDLLLLFLKRLLESGKRPDLRIIIMSATIDGPKYQQYFGSIKSKILYISGQPNYEIDVHFSERPSVSYLDDGLEIIEDLIHRKIRKDILFFITTSNEALQLCRTIRSKYPRVYCIEVYADMDKRLKEYAESRDKYLELGNYEQKLIIATNVAESSITIDGLKYVIDSGYQLDTYFDPEYFGTVYEKKLVTKAQALQRRGRVGRTEPGICYHLLTKSQFELLKDYPTPDILKENITLDILKIIHITENRTFDEAKYLLDQLMDPPTKNIIMMCYELFQLHKIIDIDRRLTNIGNIIVKFSSLPLNRSLFLIHSFELYCAREACIIISMIETLKGKIKNLFVKTDTICESECEKPVAQFLIEKLAHKRGDHFTFLKIYQEYIKARDRVAWARKYGIKIDTMLNINKSSKKYFRKILDLQKIPNPSRITNTSIKKRLLEALEKSHRHLTAKKMVPFFPKKKADAQISKDSMVYYYYDKKQLSQKSFIYDELVNINGKWEYNMVTII